LEAAVEAAASGYASARELDALSADPAAWVRVLRRLIMQTDDALRAAAHLAGEEREQILADLRAERRQLARALVERNGDEIDGPEDVATTAPTPPAAVVATVAIEETPGVAALQASWVDGRIVVWAGGPGAQRPARRQASASPPR
jgi:hypothetical protein